MTFKEKVKGALDIFHDYWDDHPLEPHWHHAIVALMEIYAELKREKLDGESGQLDTVIMQLTSLDNNDLIDIYNKLVDELKRREILAT